MSANATVASDWNPYATSRRRSTGTCGLAFVLLASLTALSVQTGPKGAGVSLKETAAVIMDHTPILRAVPHASPSSTADSLVWELRIPRALVAIFIGALLGLAGVALQGLLMNPLADPYTVGASAGAAVGAAVAEVLGIAALWAGFAGAGLAFVTAIGAVLLVYTLARVSGRVSAETFLLAGVVVGSCLFSLIPLLLVLAGRGNEVSRILFYLIGSVQSADWTRAGLLVPFVVIAAICLRVWARELNLMSLGEETAAHLGVEIEGFKRRVIVAGSLATAAAVSVGGIIGFVGLVAPHVARRIIGPDHRALIPLSALFGATLLLASDTVARALLSEQMPVGVVTSLIGAPVFCYLLRQRAKW